LDILLSTVAYCQLLYLLPGPTSHQPARPAGEVKRQQWSSGQDQQRAQCLPGEEKTLLSQVCQQE